MKPGGYADSGADIAYALQKSGVELATPLSFPFIAKPIRGRGSEGVSLIRSMDEYRKVLTVMFSSRKYGKNINLEDFLPGQEVTVTVMPPGEYKVNGARLDRSGYWSLPVVRRFNHHDGVAPYNGTVAIIHNSQVLSEEENASPEMQELCRQCELAAKLVGARAPVRIDCRADGHGKYFLFDLNMKPNMTGASRPHRPNQDSLSAIAARRYGWSYNQFLLNIMAQAWNI